MAVLPVPKTSHAAPMRGMGLKMLLVIQLFGTPLTPHCTSPLVIAGSGLLRFDGTATTLFPDADDSERTKNPNTGSRKTPAATEGLYADGTQLYAVPLELSQEPNSPKRMPKLRVNLGTTRQSSWMYGSASI